ncbi:MAG: tRNA (adenosine(37)-N6)-threonylcarbamoyltransferase complex ATPase subunit type 1 TsaE [Methylotetracoccus sp.]|nr:tRNA (adenosine(37)-N6)-threonylcarbamoyltransferase complex ATPase subunit type 1 TsaE [Methylotetracoccus sp.]
MRCFLADEAATLELGRRLFGVLTPGMIVFLRGDLGAGKTTLVRGFLRAAGFQGPVKSPTFTVVEEYVLDTSTVYHFDLYRLTSAEELEWLGFRDYLRDDSLCFIEWPERGEGALPHPDLDLRLTPDGSSRIALLVASRPAGARALDLMASSG